MIQLWLAALVWWLVAWRGRSTLDGLHHGLCHSRRSAGHSPHSGRDACSPGCLHHGGHGVGAARAATLYNLKTIVILLGGEELCLRHDPLQDG